MSILKTYITTQVFFAIIGTMNKIQRKFLLSADIQRWLQKQIFTLDKIEQFYTKTDENRAGYYLKYFPDTYIKIIIDSEGKEALQHIKEGEYISQAKNNVGRKVLKKIIRLLSQKERVNLFLFFQST